MTVKWNEGHIIEVLFNCSVVYAKDDDFFNDICFKYDIHSNLPIPVMKSCFRTIFFSNDLIDEGLVKFIM